MKNNKERQKAIDAFVKKEGMDKSRFVGEWNGKDYHEMFPKGFKKGFKIGMPLYIVDDGEKIKSIDDVDQILSTISHFAQVEDEDAKKKGS